MYEVCQNASDKWAMRQNTTTASKIFAQLGGDGLKIVYRRTIYSPGTGSRDVVLPVVLKKKNLKITRKKIARCGDDDGDNAICVCVCVGFFLFTAFCYCAVKTAGL